MRSGAPSRAALDAARAEYVRIRAEMIAAQEELDWECYRLYGLIDEDLTYPGDAAWALRSGERAFEIVLARQVAAGEEQTAWFDRHGSTPITEIPSDWPEDYRAMVQRRLDVIESAKAIRLLERPEFKRRWAADSWEVMETRAVSDWILDRLEDPALWSDAQGPRVQSVAQLAMRAASRHRPDRGGARADRGARPEPPGGHRAAGGDQAVPYLAALRYTEAGLRKRAEWEKVWDLQRREDAGETVTIPVPPKYTNKDFVKTSYWQARGKLDVPKERFISYPGCEAGADTSLVIGWAGWDHAEQARALARLLVERVAAGGVGRRAADALAGRAGRAGAVARPVACDPGAAVPDQPGRGDPRRARRPAERGADDASRRVPHGDHPPRLRRRRRKGTGA